jgi:aspartate/methionine/tyrosine aminotransferase
MNSESLQMFSGSTRSTVPPFIVMDVMEKAARREAAGLPVIHMEVGQPSAPLPPRVLDAAQRAIRTDRLGYTAALGLPKLREKISRHYRQFYRTSIVPERIAVTTGSSGGFVLALLAAFELGDRIAIAEPGYPCYRNILDSLGLEPVPIPVSTETNFQITSGHLERLQKPVHGMILANPSNPTGAGIGYEDLNALIRYCNEHQIRLLSDEIYQGIEFGIGRVSAAGIDSNVISINSFSKYFCMTGWRVGWMVLPPSLVRTVERLTQNLFIAAPTISQLAALEALDCYDEFNAIVSTYSANRDILINELPVVGFDKFIPPDGAFYLYAEIGHLTNEPSPLFCDRLLSQTGIAVTPGIDFDPIRGGATVRFSFAGSTDSVVAAAQELRMWIHSAVR